MSGTRSITSSDTLSQNFDLYKEVNLSSDDILTLRSIPIELLEIITGDRYYIIDTIAFEFTPGLTAYDGGFSSLLLISDVEQNQSITISSLLISSLDYKQLVVNSFNASKIGVIALTLNQSGLYFTTDSGDPSNGDGTLKVKIWYKIIVFG